MSLCICSLPTALAQCSSVCQGMYYMSKYTHTSPALPSTFIQQTYAKAQGKY